MNTVQMKLLYFPDRRVMFFIRESVQVRKLGWEKGGSLAIIVKPRHPAQLGGIEEYGAGIVPKLWQ